MGRSPADEPGASVGGASDAERAAGTEPRSAATAGASEAATRADLRGLRRWLWVAAAWAVAASVIALIALFTAGEDEDAASAAEAELGGRIGELERRVDDLTAELESQGAELGRLGPRLEELEATLADLRTDAREPPAELRALSTRVDELEVQVEDLGADAGNQGASLAEDANGDDQAGDGEGQ